MPKKLLPTLLLLLFLSPHVAAAFSPNYLLSDRDLTDTRGFSRDALGKFLLEHGALGTLRLPDIDGTPKLAADIIIRVAKKYRLNPKFLLVLLQREQSLVDDAAPTENQLAWAMGYAICDSCEKDDPRLQKFRGFARQVEEAAKKIREAYLPALEKTGRTASGFGPGITRQIDGVPVSPANKATAILYTYTPHLHGNENFAKIWHRYFVVRYPDGSLLKAHGSPTVWLIHYGRRQAFANFGALTSRYDPKNIITVSPRDIAMYEEGPMIAFVNYSLLQTPSGSRYLLSDDTLRPISEEAYRSIGFDPDELIQTRDEDISLFPIGEPILPESDLETLTKDDPAKFRNGTLIKTKNSPTIFLISNGVRRPILSEKVFKAYGWELKDVLVTTTDAIAVHPLGNPIEAPVAASVF